MFKIESRYSISVFGLGHVGLIIAACFASRGFKVVGFDIDGEKVRMVNSGKAPFFEPKLDELIERSVKAGMLKAVSDYVKAVNETNVTFVAVNTPSMEDGSIDLTYVKEASKMIGKALKHKHEWHLVVIKSTVVPTTTESVIKPLIESVSGKRAGSGFGLCITPEFLREGNAVEDFLHPDRIVIGEIDRRSGDVLEDLFKKFYGEEMPPLIRTTPVNAELIKYASNAFLAMKVSFINMIANLCQRLPGADVEVVAQGLGFDRRIGPYFLKAGVGWGGPCLRKDLLALKMCAKSLGVEVPLIEATLSINDTQTKKVIELVKKHLGNLRDRRIAVLGLTYKPGTDDVVDAPSIRIVEELLRVGADIVVYDPKGIENFKRIFGDRVGYADDLISCIKGADCMIIVTEWKEFKKITPDMLLKYMRTPVVVDGRRIFNPEEFSRKVRYVAIGLSQ